MVWFTLFREWETRSCSYIYKYIFAYMYNCTYMIWYAAPFNFKVKKKLPVRRHWHVIWKRMSAPCHHIVRCCAAPPWSPKNTKMYKNKFFSISQMLTIGVPSHIHIDCYPFVYRLCSLKEATLMQSPPLPPPPPQYVLAIHEINKDKRTQLYYIEERVRTDFYFWFCVQLYL